MPPALVEAREIEPLAHLQMQAALQPFVDNAISKTINVPADHLTIQAAINAATAGDTINVAAGTYSELLA